MTKFGTVTQVIEKHVSKGSAMPTSQGAGPQCPPKIWDPCVSRQFDISIIVIKWHTWRA